MATNTSHGVVEFFEDFTNIAVIADKPEYGVDTDPAVEVLSGGIGGVLRWTLDAGQTNIGGVNFGTLQWSAYDNFLEMTARVKLSALGTASERLFVGFTDVQEATITEFPFTGATTVTTAATNPTNCVGFFWEGDMTGAYWAPASQNADAIAVHGSANMTAKQKTDATIVAGTWQELKMRISRSAEYVEFFVDNKPVYTYESSATAAVADVALIPEVVATEGTTAINFDLDYVRVRMGRDN